jgi:hypothetical protein
VSKLGEVLVLVDGTEGNELAERGFDSVRRRRLDCLRQELGNRILESLKLNVETDLLKVGTENLRKSSSTHGVEAGTREESVVSTVLNTSGTSSTLLGVGLADPGAHELSDTASLLVLLLSELTSVDNVLHIGNGNRSLSNVGGQDNLADSRRDGFENLVLVRNGRVKHVNLVLGGVRKVGTKRLHGRQSSVKLDNLVKTGQEDEDSSIFGGVDNVTENSSSKSQRNKSIVLLSVDSRLSISGNSNLLLPVDSGVVKAGGSSPRRYSGNLCRRNGGVNS